MPERDWHGRFVKSSNPSPSLIQVKSFKKPKLESEIPPVVDLKVTNPVTYLKLWWKKIMSGEGISIRIHPVTAILLVLTLSSSSFFFGRFFQLKSDLLETYLPQFASVSTIEAAFTGKLYISEGKYYLTQSESQALLIKPGQLNISSYTHQNVFVSGKFNPLNRSLSLTNISIQ